MWSCPACLSSKDTRHPCARSKRKATSEASTEEAEAPAPRHSIARATIHHSPRRHLPGRLLTMYISKRHSLSRTIAYDSPAVACTIRPLVFRSPLQQGRSLSELVMNSTFPMGHDPPYSLNQVSGSTRHPSRGPSECIWDAEGRGNHNPAPLRPDLAFLPTRNSECSRASCCSKPWNLIQMELVGKVPSGTGRRIRVVKSTALQTARRAPTDRRPSSMCSASHESRTGGAGCGASSRRGESPLILSLAYLPEDTYLSLTII